MITRDTILMDRHKEYPLTPSMINNLTVLVQKITSLEAAYGARFIISSGYRPGRFNAAVGGAHRSAHTTCQAVDISDKDGKIKDWCLKNIALLNASGLYMEDPLKTKTWVHLQIRRTTGNPFKV